MLNRLIKEDGTLLVEILVAVLVFLLLMGIVLSILVTGRNAWHIEDTGVELQQELRKAMTILVEDLRQTSSVKIIDVPPNGNPYTSITFQIPATVTSGYTLWGDSTQFRLGGLNGKQLLKRVGLDESVVANNIVSLEFSRALATRDILKVVLQAEKNTLKGTQITTNLDFQVKLRN